MAAEAEAACVAGAEAEAARAAEAEAEAARVAEAEAEAVRVAEAEAEAVRVAEAEAEAARMAEVEAEAARVAEQAFPSTPADADPITEQLAQQLVGMGFEYAAATNAIQASNGNIEAAINFMLEQEAHKEAEEAEEAKAAFKDAQD